MSSQKKTITYFYILLSPLMYFSAAVFTFAETPFNFNPLIAAFLAFYAITVLKAAWFWGVFSLYSLYLYAGMFFMYSRLIFHLTGYRSFLDITFPANHIFSDTTGIIFISISFLSYFVIDIAYTKLHKQDTCVNRLKNYPLLGKISSWIIYLELPAYIYKTRIMLNYVKGHGYLSMYNGDASNIAYPFWVRGSTTIIITAYILFLISYPKEKKFIQVSFVYIFCLFFSALSGGRGRFIISTLSVIYFYIHFYHKKLRIKHAVLFFAAILGISIYLGHVRQETKNTIIGDIVIQSFYGQTHTMVLPLTIIEMSDKLQHHPYPFIFSPLFEPFLRIIFPYDKPDSPILEEKYNSLAVVASNYYYSNAFTTGASLGGSFLAEMYDCGWAVGVIIWSIILAWVMSSIEKNFLRKNIYIPLLWVLVFDIVYLSRSIFFGFILEMMYIVFAMILLVFINVIFYPKKIRCPLTVK